MLIVKMEFAKQFTFCTSPSNQTKVNLSSFKAVAALATSTIFSTFPVVLESTALSSWSWAFRKI
jgi:hypothetical protein